MPNATAAQALGWRSGRCPSGGACCRRSAGQVGKRCTDRPPESWARLEEAERAQLIRSVRRAKFDQDLAMRAKTLLACAEGGMDKQAQPVLGWISPPRMVGGRGSSPSVWRTYMRPPVW